MCIHFPIWSPIGQRIAVPYHENPWLLLCSWDVRLDTRCGFPPRSCFHLPSLFFSFSPQISENSIMDEKFGIMSPQNPQPPHWISQVLPWSNTGHRCILFLLYLSLSSTINHVFFWCIHSVHSLTCPLLGLGFSCCLSVAALKLIVFSPCLLCPLFPPKGLMARVSLILLFGQTGCWIIIFSPWFGAGWIFCTLNQ